MKLTISSSGQFKAAHHNWQLEKVVMLYQIHNWLEISDNFFDSILLGNGASIGIDGSFSYCSLKQHATDNGLFTHDVQSLFSFFNTNDFELVLRLVWQANKVNSALNIPDQRTRVAYEHVRDCLIRAVQSLNARTGH